MGQTEYKIFVFLATLILLVFIGGIILFIFQYHRKKLLHDKEKAIINVKHTQDLLNTKLEIQQQTMQDISREMHDNVVQQLALASILANQLSFENRYPAANERINSIAEVLNNTVTELRSISRNLQNTSEGISKLEDIIQAECARVNSLNICRVDYSFNADNFGISTTIKIFIHRIIQEFLQNSLKHSDCKNVLIDFDYREAGMWVRVTDDGIGFDMKSHSENKKDGIGLLNMRKRAELIGADFDMKSELNKGTYLSIFIPANKLNVS